MERDDVEGAKAAAEYFLALYPYVYVTGDLDAWNEFSHPECQFCASVVRNVENLHANGGYADGPRIDVISAEAAPPDGEYEFFSVWIEAEEAAFAHYDGSGAVVAEDDGATVNVDFALERRADAWLVRGVVGTDMNEEASDVQE